MTATADATAAAPPLDLAIVTGGDRTDKLLGPLATTGASVVVDPQSLRRHDAIICDTPDRRMFRAVATKRLHGTPVIFRMRGDPFTGLDQWIDSRAKRWLSRSMLGWVDGCLAMAGHQARTFERHTAIEPSVVGLPKRVEEWPDASHSDHELRILSLTNATYPEKVDPLIEVMPDVSEVLASVGGCWRIGSWRDDTDHADRLRESAKPYDRIAYGGRLDAHDALGWANVMLHRSRLDAQPNAVLEGLASGLPVVTNDYAAFRNTPAPLLVRDGLAITASTLANLADAGQRREYGARGPAYVREHHRPERIGAELMAATRAIIGGERL